MAPADVRPRSGLPRLRFALQQPRGARVVPYAWPLVSVSLVRVVVLWGGVFFLFGLGCRVDGVRLHFRRRWHPGTEALADLFVEVGHSPLELLDEDLVAGEAGED